MLMRLRPSRRSCFASVVAGLLVIHQLTGVDESTRADDAVIKVRTMRVRVRSQEGTPLKGVRIHASLWTKEKFDRNRDYETNADGETFVELPNSLEILRLWATHQGHVGLFAQWWPEQEREAREIPQEYLFELDKGTVIGGIVTNKAGEPVAGAKVAVQLTHPSDESVLDHKAIPNRWLAEGNDCVTTDAEGRWSLDNVPAGDQVRVSVLLTHSDYVSESQWGSLQAAQGVTMEQFRDRSATIAIHKGIRLSGFVVTPDRKRMEGAVIVWGNDPYFETGSQEVRTDAKGHYRLPPLPEGKLKVTVIAEGWSPQQEEIDLKTEHSTLNFKLEPGKTIRFRFVDANDKPLPGVSVGIAEWRGSRALYNHRHPNVLDTKIPIQSDEKGDYEWTWAPADGVTYQFYKEGYLGRREVEYTAGGVYVERLREVNE